MNWKAVISGILLLIVVAAAGFFYRARQMQTAPPTACPTDAKVCPDGTGLGRTGPDCTFPVCGPPNVELPATGISFALPAGYVTALPSTAGIDQATIAAFSDVATDTPDKELLIREYPLTASTSASDFIRKNAIGNPSGMPVPVTSFTSIVIGQNRYSVVTLERFEGVVDTAYYLQHGNDVLRFDALSRSVNNWTAPSLDPFSLPTASDLRTLLSTLQGD